MKYLITGIALSFLAVSSISFADDTVVKKTSVYNDGMNKRVVKQVKMRHHHHYHHTPYGWHKGVKTGWHHRDVPPGTIKKTTVIHKNY